MVLSYVAGLLYGCTVFVLVMWFFCWCLVWEAALLEGFCGCLWMGFVLVIWGAGVFRVHMVGVMRRLMRVVR